MINSELWQALGDNNSLILLILDVADPALLTRVKVALYVEPIQVLPGTWDHETNRVILVIWVTSMYISCRLTLPEHTGADCM